MCVCVQVHALRENVNVVMNPERSLVIGAIDRNHLMQTHTDAVISQRLLKCNRLDRPEGTLVPRPTIPTCVCLVHFAHGFTALRKPQNIHPDNGVK